MLLWASPLRIILGAGFPSYGVFRQNCMVLHCATDQPLTTCGF